MTFAEEQERGPVDGPDAGGTSQGEPGTGVSGTGESGTGDDAQREQGGDPDPGGSSDEKGDGVASVDEPSSSKGND